MHKLIIFFLALFVISCTTTQNASSGSGDTAILGGYTVKNSADLTDLVNYMVIKRNGDFENRFTAPAGAGEVDFSDDFVVAVVGLPSNKDMSIDIVKTERAGDVLNVHYDVNYTWKETTTPMAPAAVLTVSKDRGYERVNFYSQNTLRKSIEL